MACLWIRRLSPKRPDDVRDALLDALRQVRQHSSLLIEVKLLHLELIIDHTLKEHKNNHWKPTSHLKQVLQSSRYAAKVYSPPCLEGNFYKYGEAHKPGKGAQVVIILSIIPRELLPSIEVLPEAIQKRLARFIAEQVIHKSMDAWITGEFDLATGRIPEQAKKLPRPRVRHDDDGTITSSAPLMNYLELKRNRSTSPDRPIKRARNTWYYSLAPQPNVSSPLLPARYGSHHHTPHIKLEDIAATLGYSTLFPAECSMVLPRPELLDTKHSSAQYSRPTTVIPNQAGPLNHTISGFDNTESVTIPINALCEDFSHTTQEVLTELEGWENDPADFIGGRCDAAGNNEDYLIPPGWESSPTDFIGGRRDAAGYNEDYFTPPGWENGLAGFIGGRRDAAGYNENYFTPGAPPG